MRLHDLQQTHARPKARRVGRGNAAGGGTTAGRGTKGQKARTGANSNVPRTFIGGSTSFVQAMPKLKGFKSHAEKPLALSAKIVSKHFAAGEKVTLLALIEKGVVSPAEALKGVKIVGGTNGAHGLTFENDNPKLLLSKKLVAA